jgi:hypothetical protein
MLIVITKVKLKNFCWNGSQIENQKLIVIPSARHIAKPNVACC